MVFQNYRTVPFQLRNILCNDFPSGLWIYRAIAMSNNVSHSLDLPP